MKTFLVSFAVVLLLATGAMATDGPIDKGSMILGGSAYFMSQSGDLYENSAGDARTTISIVPSVGYFVAPSIMVGAQVQFTNTSQGDPSTTQIGGGPVVGYYFNMDATRTEVKGSLYPYIQAFFLYSSIKFDDGHSSDYTDKITTFGGQGGVCYMLSKAVSADISVRFQSDSYDADGSDDNVTGTVLQFGVGFTAFMWN